MWRDANCGDEFNAAWPDWQRWCLTPGSRDACQVKAHGLSDSQAWNMCADSN